MNQIMQELDTIQVTRLCAMTLETWSHKEFAV